MANENENNNEKSPVALFQEIETELSELLFLQNEGSETDSPIQFIKTSLKKLKKILMVMLSMKKKKPFLAFSPSFLQLS